MDVQDDTKTRDAPPESGATAVPPGEIRVGAKDAPEAGASIGRYVVRRELGRGGVGVVLEAYDPVLDRPVALKLLIAGRDASDAQLRRFLREAKAASSLRHPHIVPVHDLGEVDGRAYFAMDRVDGRSLGDAIEADGPLPPRRAFEIALGIARALEHAHERGIVHRDVKPDNVLVDGNGHGYLTDFGLARDLELDARLTASGQFVGTPAYASPEQLCGSSVDARSDVYSLGATIFEAIAGEPPFDADSFASLTWRIVHETARPLRALRPEVARDVEAIVSTCLEKDPARRYPSARVLALDLERFLRGETVRARPRSLTRRAVDAIQKNPVRAAFGTLVLALVLGTGGYAAALRLEVAEHEQKRQKLDALIEPLRRLHDESERIEARRRELAALGMEAGTQETLDALARALAIDPTYWEGHCDRARLLRRLSGEKRRAGKPDEARVAAVAATAEVGSALALAPWLPHGPLMLLDAEIHRRELRAWPEARKRYEALAAVDSAAFGAYARARLAFARGDRPGAALENERARQLLPSLREPRLLEAEMALEDADPTTAVATLDDLTQASALEDPERFLLRALALERLGLERQAAEDLDRALELDPYEPRARRERGRLRLLAGSAGTALADLERAVQLDESDQVALVLRAIARRSLGLIEDATQDLEAARKLGVVVTPTLREYVLGPGEDH